MTVTADFATYAGTGSASNASTYNTASQTPVAGDRVLVAVGSALSSGTPAAPTLSGNGQTWTQIGGLVNGLHRLTLFSAVMTSPTAGLVAIAFAGVTQQRCTWSFGGFRSSLGSPITLGTVATNSGTGTTGSVTVVDPGGGDGVWAALYKASTGSVTKDANYTLGEESPAGAEVGWQQTQYLLNSVSDLTPGWSWATSAAWVAGGVVLLEPGAPPAVAFPDVVVSGAKKTVANMSVIVGGTKKPVVGLSVVVSGTKKPVV